jgi:hypothetical protein
LQREPVTGLKPWIKQPGDEQIVNVAVFIRELVRDVRDPRTSAFKSGFVVHQEVQRKGKAAGTICF